MRTFLDGNSEIGAQVRSNLYYLICLRRLNSSGQSQIGFFSLKRPIFLHACTTCSELPSNISTMIFFCFFFMFFVIPEFVIAEPAVTVTVQLENCSQLTLYCNFLFLSRSFRVKAFSYQIYLSIIWPKLDAICQKRGVLAIKYVSVNKI